MKMKVVHEIKHKDFNDLIMISANKAAMHFDIVPEELTFNDFTDWLEMMPDDTVHQLRRSE